jgi:hypothetical protein
MANSYGYLTFKKLANGNFRGVKKDGNKHTVEVGPEFRLCLPEDAQDQNWRSRTVVAVDPDTMQPVRLMPIDKHVTKSASAPKQPPATPVKPPELAKPTRTKPKAAKTAKIVKSSKTQ